VDSHFERQVDSHFGELISAIVVGMIPAVTEHVKADEPATPSSAASLFPRDEFPLSGT